MKYKYRIIKRHVAPYFVTRYILQKKILWWWTDIPTPTTFYFLVEAEEYLRNRRLAKEKPEVVKYIK